MQQQDRRRRRQAVLGHIQFDRAVKNLHDWHNRPSFTESLRQWSGSLREVSGLPYIRWQSDHRQERFVDLLGHRAHRRGESQPLTNEIGHEPMDSEIGTEGEL